MLPNDYTQLAGHYARVEFAGILFLAFRDIPALIKRYAKGQTTLDYGCGAGRSTRFLKRQGLTVVGVDISDAMLAMARQQDPGGDYRPIESGVLPFEDASFDLAFSSFCFLEMPSVAMMTAAASDIARVLKPGGHFILLTTADELYDHEWAGLKVDYPENKAKRSGSLVRVFLTDVELELFDYYWTDADYRRMLADAGYTSIDLYQPLGRPEDGIAWITEDRIPPFSIYVVGK